MRRSILTPLLGCTLTLALSASADAQTARPSSSPPPAMNAVDPLLFRGLSFRSIGPSRGGRVTTVTGVPSEPRTFYMGVASGGLFRTTDAGVTWTPITEQVPVGSMGSIAVADSDPNILYLGTGSDGVRSNVSTGRGVYKSTDAGKSWQFAGLYNVGQIGAVRIHPTNPDIVWVAANGDIFKPTADRGIYKTTDGGRNWRKTLFVSDSTGAMDVELQPGNPNVVYAWLSRIERKPWTIISGAYREGGFYKSTDGGETWAEITTGLPNELIGKGNLAVTAANPQRIYALIEAKPGGGLYRSDDAGQSWELVNSQGSLVQRPFYYTTLGADPTNADVVYAGAEGFFKSTDGGRTMTTLRTPHGDNHDIWVNPNDGRVMVQANDGGANVSFDGGATWSTQLNQVTAEIYGVWVDNAFPYKLYGAQQDNSTIIINSTAEPFDRSAWTSGPGCETGPIIPHPTKPNIVYGSCKGQYEVYNAISGMTRPYWIGGQSLYGNAGRDLILRFQRTSPMEVSPHDPDVLYYGSQYVHRTRDLGVNWEQLGTKDLTWFPPHAQGTSGEPITRDGTGEEFYSTLYAIRESLHEPGVIWTGANDGPFHISRDNGRTWTNITPKDLPEGGRVQFIEPSPHRRGSAYYAVYRYLLGDYRPYIYRTDDYGATWRLLTDGRNGIPADVPTRVVREDPSREGLLYAGTEFGMYISFNNGANWQSFQLDMPYTPITDIKVHRKDLVVSTQGRAFWILDNLSSLHQISPQITTQAAHLFRPRDGYRTRVAPHLYGPMVEYYLPAAPAGPVVIEILDPRGEVIGSFSSAAPAPAAARPARPSGDPDEDMMAGRGAPAASAVPLNRVTANAGINRFVWNVQRPVPGLPQQQQPAPPGQYQVRLQVGSVTQTQPLNVLVDPNVAAEGITAADLVEQYEHNVRVAQLNASVQNALQRIRQARQRLAEGTPERAQLEAVAAKIETEPIRYGRPGLQQHISYLAGMTRGPDMRIGRDAIARYEVLRAEWDAVLAELNRLIGS